VADAVQRARQAWFSGSVMRTTAAAVRARRDHDVAAVGPDQGAGDGEAEAARALRRGQFDGRARPLNGDLDNRLIHAAVQAHADGPAPRGEADGIVEHVHQHLFDQGRMHMGRRQFFHFECQRQPAQRHRQPRTGRLDEGAQVDGGATWRRPYTSVRRAKEARGQH